MSDNSAITHLTISAFLGIIAGLPTFQAIGKDYLFDDSLYWNVS